MKVDKSNVDAWLAQAQRANDQAYRMYQQYTIELRTNILPPQFHPVQRRRWNASWVCYCRMMDLLMALAQVKDGIIEGTTIPENHLQIIKAFP